MTKGGEIAATQAGRALVSLTQGAPEHVAAILSILMGAGLRTAGVWARAQSSVDPITNIRNNVQAQELGNELRIAGNAFYAIAAVHESGALMENLAAALRGHGTRSHPNYDVTDKAAQTQSIAYTAPSSTGIPGNLMGLLGGSGAAAAGAGAAGAGAGAAGAGAAAGAAAAIAAAAIAAEAAGQASAAAVEDAVRKAGGTEEQAKFAAANTGGALTVSGGIGPAGNPVTQWVLDQARLAAQGGFNPVTGFANLITPPTRPPQPGPVGYVDGNPYYDAQSLALARRVRALEIEKDETLSASQRSGIARALRGERGGL